MYRLSVIIVDCPFSVKAVKLHTLLDFVKKMDTSVKRATNIIEAMGRPL